MCSIPSDLLESSASPSTSQTSPPSLLSLLLKQGSAPSQSESKPTRKRKRHYESDALSLFEALPQDLVELASQPTVKPTIEPSEIFEEPPKGRKGRKKVSRDPGNVIKNVAGNIRTVLRARVLIHDILRGTAILPRDWRKKMALDDDTAPSLIVDGNENRTSPPLLCPTCGEHI
jgi:hypothetical protein